MGDVGASSSARVIDVHPISARPSGMEEDLAKDQALIDQALGGPGTSGTQVPISSPLSSRLPRREIDWNDTPWKEDIFDDNEDMRDVRNAIVTLNVVLTVGFLIVLLLTTFFRGVADELLCWSSRWLSVLRVGSTC
jgi:hypothetical protein